MKNQNVVVFATSFLDTPVVESEDTGRGKRILDQLVAESGGTIGVEYRCDRSPLTPPAPGEFSGVTAVIADLERYDQRLLGAIGPAGGGTVRLIARYGVGYSSVDIEAATRAGILVTNTPGANSRPTAEWTVATLLDVAGRRIPHHERAATGNTKAGPSRLDVTGKTLGVVGTGAVGRLVVELLSGFAMNVIAFDLYPDHEWAQRAGVDYVSFEELLTRGDYVTLHAATEKRILGREQIGLMRPSCTLVNCARGSLVDNRAVYEAVRDGRLWGYGLDEVWTETDLDLSGLNIAVSPHVASDTDGGKFGMQIMSATAVADFLSGRTPKHVLNPKLLDHA